MGCVPIDGRPFCASWEEARVLDTDRNGSWLGKAGDVTVEIGIGVRDAILETIAFPENVLKYVTGTDARYGQGRPWSRFGEATQLDWSLNNPLFRAMESVNSIVYGGFNLVLGYTPYYLSQEMGMDIPFFTPPPATIRDQARDAAFLAGILLGPRAGAMGREALGIPEKPVPVHASPVAEWVRTQQALSRMSPGERALALLLANSEAGAIEIPQWLRRLVVAENPRAFFTSEKPRDSFAYYVGKLMQERPGEATADLRALIETADRTGAAFDFVDLIKKRPQLVPLISNYLRDVVASVNGDSVSAAHTLVSIAYLHPELRPEIGYALYKAGQYDCATSYQIWTTWNNHFGRRN